MKVLTIDGTKHAKCELCGTVNELRPYGPNGENVCFDCMKKNEKAAKRRFDELLDGNDLVIIK